MSSIIKVKNSLLFLTQKLSDLKKNVIPLLEESIKYTNTNLYIYINLSPITNLNEKAQLHPLEDRFQLKIILAKLYQNSFKINPNINVTCLLHNFHMGLNVKKNLNKKEYDLILTDSVSEDRLLIESYIEGNLPNFKKSFEKIPILTIKCVSDNDENESNSYFNTVDPQFDQLYKNKIFQNSILGGTFDRLHIGHKIMLSESVLLTKNRLLIGITCENLLVNKKLLELIQDIDIRCKNVEDFLNTIAPNIEVVTVPIKDPFGPSIVEKDYQCLIVSEETQKTGELVNQKRIENNLPTLDIHVISLIKDEVALIEKNGDEDKISSSNQRRHLLGTLLKPPQIPYDSSKPYVIGLTGGLASGKSSIRKDLENLGVVTVDCDKLGHKAYEKNTNAYFKIIETFGNDILDDNQNINRQLLGKKVFQSPTELKKLTDIVWPQIKLLLQEEIDRSFKNGHKIIVVEAAVLLEAKWEENMNEVWVVFVSNNEAISRATQRDNQNIEKVKNILDSQLSNRERISKANVVLSSFWEREYTIKQVKKAWDLLLERTIKLNSKL